jgi:hypothetical protein
VYTSTLPHSCCMSHPSRSSHFDHPKKLAAAINCRNTNNEILYLFIYFFNGNYYYYHYHHHHHLQYYSRAVT